MSSLGYGKVNPNFATVQFYSVQSISSLLSITHRLEVYKGKSPASAAMSIQYHLNSLQRAKFTKFFIQLSFSSVQT